MSELDNYWKGIVTALERPAVKCLDAFILSTDDPRMIRGHYRMLAEISLGGKDGEAGRIDLTRVGMRFSRVRFPIRSTYSIFSSKCETRHHLARTKEELGDGKPLTNWSDSGGTAMPGFAFNEWMDKQVNRIHDLTDINLLRLAKTDMDATHKQWCGTCRRTLIETRWER
jgi:hypothetical protein